MTGTLRDTERGDSLSGPSQKRVLTPASWAMTKEVSGIQWQVSVSGGCISFQAVSDLGATGRSNEATPLRKKRLDWTKGPGRGQPEGQLTPTSYCDTQRTQNPGGQVWGAFWMQTSDWHR